MFPVLDGLRATFSPTTTRGRRWCVRCGRIPGKELARLFPKLPRLIGTYEVAGKVVAVPMDLWVAEPQGRSGLIVIGDAYQSACPATGTGFIKVLNDVDVLTSLIPDWLASPGMSAAKVDAFYSHPKKCAMDAGSLAGAAYLKRLRTDPGLRMRVHRVKENALVFWRRCWQRPPRPEAVR